MRLNFNTLTHGQSTACRYVQLALIPVVLLLLSATASGQYPWGYPPPGYPAPTENTATQPATTDTPEFRQPYMPRFRPPASSRPWQPQQPMGWPPQQPAYQSPRAPQTQVKPVIEAFISSTDAVEQQNLVYRIKILSSGNLKNAAPQLPSSDSFAIRALGEPKNRTRWQGTKQKFTTEYTYLLVPMRAGKLTLPRALVTGDYNDGQTYEASSAQPLELNITPAIKEAALWLPLHDLQIRSKMLDANNPTAGSPMTLEVTLDATGITGAQIPSVASQLYSSDYKIYPAETTSKGSLSTNGTDLYGQRTERFTLVPQYGGRLTIPAVQISWWNIDQQMLQTTSMPMRHYNIQGPARPDDSLDGQETGIFTTTNLFFWLPLLLTALFLLVSWLKVLLGNGRLPSIQWIPRLLKGILGDLYQPVAALMRKLSPRRYAHRVRTWVGSNLPVSWKLWFCLRSVEKEEDADEWGHALQILAHKHLGVRSHASLPVLGVSIAACHPMANAREVEHLMRELDESIYGGQPIPSFAHWKHTFKEQIKPRLFPLRFRHCSEPEDKQQLLPDLNPVN